MKKPIVFIVFLIIFLLSNSSFSGIVKVKGYYKKDGTYVHSYTRHSPGTAPKSAHERSYKARYQFMEKTGYPNGRPGYVIDHIVPLACGGADDPSNMQWQTVEEAKEKDKWERKNCKCKHKNGH